MKKNIILLSTFIALLSSCSSQRSFETSLSKALNDHPEIITSLVEDNPEEFITSFQIASQRSKDEVAKRWQQAQNRKFKNDLMKGDRDSSYNLK
jgi:hypothetical protein